MFVQLIIVFLKIFMFLFIVDVESQDQTPMEYNSPLVMVGMDGDLPEIPTTVEIADGKTILKCGSTTNVKYFCPTLDTNMINLIEKQQSTAAFRKHNCLSETIFPESSSKLCKEEVHPFLREYKYEDEAGLLTEDHIECGKNHTGLLYGLSYLVCLPNDPPIRAIPGSSKFVVTTDVATYNFCYEHKRKAILYTQHLIVSPSILKNINYLGDLATFKWDKISSDSYNIFDKAFEQMKLKLKNKELVPHMSIPPRDMVFGSWKKTLYHYSNIIVMPKEISSVWIFIDNRIRHAAAQSESDFEIFMGEFITEGYKFWCKLVFDGKNSKGAAIIVHSDPKAETEVPNVCLPCHLDKWDGSDEVKTELNRVRCCKIYFNHLELFGLMHETKQNGKVVKVFKYSDHPKIAANYLNLDDF